MFKKITLQEGEIELGKPLPWPIYDAEGTLLLQENTLISSEKQLSILLEQGLYRGLTSEEVKEFEESKDKKEAVESKKVLMENPFVMKVSCTVAIQQVLDELSEDKKVDVLGPVDFASQQIRSCCNKDANATLAAVHLSKGFTYEVVHPVHTAILCEILIRHLSFTPAQEQTIISAALTMNIGMHKLQGELFAQTESLTEIQQKLINEHPAKSVAILKKSGVEDTNWLNIILHHHERMNGKGYPKGLKGNDIHQGAKVVALADMYAALITPRAYREPIIAQQALKSVFTERGGSIDDRLAEMLIQEVGIYPPGTFVKLANCEVGVVIKRWKKGKAGKRVPPEVCSLISSRGTQYDRPAMRDTNLDVYKIVGTCQPDFDYPIDFPDLWGYK